MQSVSYAEQETIEEKKADGVSTEQKTGNDLEKYEKAVEKDPDSDVANYNLGTAYYRKGEYEKSIDSFMKSLNTEDREIEAKAIYNMANSKYKMGSLQAERDLNSAIGHYKESLDYYRRAMELDESDRDAKYNHELVEKKVKILLDKMKNQQQDQNQDENKDSKDSQGEEGQQQKTKQDQQKNNQDQNQSAENEQSGEQKDQEGSGADKEQEEQETQSAGKEQESSEQMSAEEARMLLEAFGQEEAREEVKQKLRGRHGEVLKDW